MYRKIILIALLAVFVSCPMAGAQVHEFSFHQPVFTPEGVISTFGIWMQPFDFYPVAPVVPVFPLIDFMAGFDQSQVDFDFNFPGFNPIAPQPEYWQLIE